MEGRRGAVSLSLSFLFFLSGRLRLIGDVVRGEMLFSPQPVAGPNWCVVALVVVRRSKIKERARRWNIEIGRAVD